MITLHKLISIICIDFNQLLYCNVLENPFIFSSDEVLFLVDLVFENNAKLFGSLSYSLSYDD